MSIKSLFDLSGRTALITGGSRGLGLQIAEALGELGATIAITARKSDELEAARDTLAKLGVQAHPLVCDLGRAERVAPMVDQALAKLGRIDILVNNAGTTWGAPTEDYPLDAWVKLLNLNLTGAFLTTQRVGKLAMIPARYGKIVNIASVAGLHGHLAEDMMPTIAYGTSKGGLISFTRVLAAEWGPHNITVNAIAPGWFPSKMTKATLAEHGDAFAARSPLKRLGGEEDLKGTAALLASEASRHITGQTIVVDGGASVI